jgi:peptidyl-prolyl cis-trans isomerase SurA
MSCLPFRSKTLTWMTGACAGMLLACGAAQAQQVVLTVNGDPITTFDIEQRSRLLLLTTRKQSSRAEVIDDLINDKVKVHIGRRYKLEIDDSDVNRSFNDMARRMRMDGDGLVKVLAQQGVQAYTLRDRIRGEIAWQQIVRAKFQSSLQQTEKEIEQKIEMRKKEDKEVITFEYTLRPILFVISRGAAGEGAVETRRREAEALRARFTDCDSGISLARGMREVAVREPIRKSSADLAPALREILDNMQVGRLTAPEVTQHGVEVFALCGKRESKTDSIAKREAQNEIFSEKYQAAARKFLKEVRAQAMIEYKDGSDAKTAGGNPR